MKITKAFKASENGHTVIDYQPGEYDTLPPKALEHAKLIGAISAPKDKVKKPAQNKAAKPESNK